MPTHVSRKAVGAISSVSEQAVGTDPQQKSLQTIIIIDLLVAKRLSTGACVILETSVYEIRSRYVR